MLLPSHPLVDEIRARYQARSSGVLDLVCPEGERVRISIREGLIDAVSVVASNAGSYLNSHRLGHYLVEDAGLTVRDLVAIQSESRRRRIVFGEAALRKGLVDGATLQSLVRQQSFELLRHVVGEGGSVSVFEKGGVSYRVPAGIRFEHVLLDLARHGAEPYRGGDGQWIVLREGSELSVYPWYPKELAVLSRLQQPTTVGGLRAVTSSDEVHLERVLGVLSQLDLLETLEGFSGGALAGGNAGLPAPGTPMDLEKLIPVATPAFLDEKLEIATSGSSFTSEQFRNLKVQMSEALGPGPRVFAVSSPDAGDGKSLISLALAFSFAADPARKSLIVDCDLRKPAVQKYLGVTSEPGLLQCLSNGQAGPLCYLRRIGNLYFLTTGGIAPNPVEILSMDKTSRMLGELKRHFDTIVLDAPPYSPIADARLVTKLADGLVLVVRRGRTAFGTTERTLKALDPKKLLGIVFNDVKPMLFNTYQSSYYYGASYGNDESPALNKPRTRTYLDQ